MPSKGETKQTTRDKSISDTKSKSEKIKDKVENGTKVDVPKLKRKNSHPLVQTKKLVRNIDTSCIKNYIHDIITSGGLSCGSKLSMMFDKVAKKMIVCVKHAIGSNISPKKKTIQVSELYSAFLLLRENSDSDTDKSLVDTAIKFSRKAIETFLSQKKIIFPKEESKPVRSLQSQSGLRISVSRVRKILTDKYKYKIQKEVPIALTAFIESLFTTFFNSIKADTGSSNRTRITPNHVKRILNCSKLFQVFFEGIMIGSNYTDTKLSRNSYGGLLLSEV